MSKKEKLLLKLLSENTEITFDELKSLLLSLGFRIENKGKTSGSRVSFVRDGLVIILHRPHPQKELKKYQVKQVISQLREEKLI